MIPVLVEIHQIRAAWIRAGLTNDVAARTQDGTAEIGLGLVRSRYAEGLHGAQL